MTETIASSSIRASLILRGFGDDPQVITELTGLRPTRAGRAGDPLVGPSGQATTRTVRRTYWSLHSRRDPVASLSEHVSDILEQLGGAAHRFTRLPEGTTATLDCTVILDDEMPILSLSNELLRQLGDIGAELEIDILSVDGGPEES